MKSINEIDFSPKSGKDYWINCHREWREEFIYFLLVDRFHDSTIRDPLSFKIRHSGFGTKEQLKGTFGGTLKGVIDNLNYIKNLGCTAIWLSPVFENNPESYHGYAIQNYLEIDRRWGSKEELEQLVNCAHELNLRVFLDIVLHHSGDNWSYPDDYDYYYFNGIRFPFGQWRENDKPLPLELKDPEVYNRKGQIINFDAYPETREGDFYALKTFRNDASPASERIQEILVAIHCYWIREVDIDGFRLDAVKHMYGDQINRFCSLIREYAYSLGKRNFFLFGEIIGNDELGNPYLGPKMLRSSFDQNVYYGLDSVLDHPLHSVLAGVIKGNSSPGKLIERYDTLQRNALNRGEYGDYLVTYIDDHDQVGMTYKRRFGHEAEPQQIVAGMGFLLCALGTPCIYYGTEQGLNGSGTDDRYIREGLFDPEDNSSNLLNQESWIYSNISDLAHLRLKEKALKFGRMYFRQTSMNGVDFHYPDCPECLLAFSRILFEDEITLVYNSSLTYTKVEYVLIDKAINTKNKYLKYVFGKSGRVKIRGHDTPGNGPLYFKVTLKPMQLLVLKNKQFSVSK